MAKRARIRELLLAAVWQSPVPHSHETSELLRFLADTSPGGSAHLLGLELDAAVTQVVGHAWRYGWQPADVARLLARQFTPLHRSFAVDAIARDAAGYSEASLDLRWVAQLRDLEAAVWWNPGRPHLQQWAKRERVAPEVALRCALAVLAMLLHLPKLPKLCAAPGDPVESPPNGASRAAPPGTARRRRPRADDARMLERVRALLAKAESTTFEAEAEALTTKAQELISRHSIDESMLFAGDGPGHGPDPVGVRIGIDNPYASAKSILLGKVAHANSCRAVWSKDLGFSTLFGMGIDLDAVEVLYTSLLVQATSAMVAAGPQSDWRGRSRTRSYRQSFLISFALRIGERLREANDATRQAAAEHYGEALLPVLASKKERVDSAVSTVFPDLGTIPMRVSNAAGYAAGRAAAELAWLSPRRQVTSNL